MVAKKKPGAPGTAGQYVVHVLHEDAVRVDLYDQCMTKRTGDLEEGWGSVTLTPDQAMALSREIAAAALRAKPTKKGKK